MTRPRALAAAAALALALGASGHLDVPPAAAEQRDPDLVRARKLFARGEKLFALGRFDEALEAYEAAFEAKALPDFLFNVGQCHRNLGNYDQAIFSYRKYLKLQPDAHNREAVEKLIAELEEKRDAERAREDSERLGLKSPPPDDRDDDGISPWWYVGGATAVAVVAVGTVLLVSGDDGPSIPDSDLGNLDFGR